MVGYEAIDDSTLEFEFIVRPALKKLLGDIESGRVARQRLKYLEANYHHLDDAFTALLPIRDGDHTRILLAGYPLPDRGISDDTVCGRDVGTAQRADDLMDGLNYFGQFVDADGKLAKTDVVADVHDAGCKLDLERVDWLSGDLDPDATTSQTWLSRVACANAKAKETPVQRDAAAKLKWSYVTGFIEKAWPHGYCAAKPCPDGQDSKKCSAEILKMPGFVPPQSVGSSRPYSIQDFLPYASRERWFRTFNDTYLTTNWQASTAKRLNDIDNVMTAFTTGAMHPSAEGYAAAADFLFRTLVNDLCRRKEIDESDQAIAKLCLP